MNRTEQIAPPPEPRRIATLLFGRPLSSGDDVKERVGPAAGIPVFGLDALSSAAYGPEAALAILIPLGVAGVAEILPISLAIIALLSVVYFSYRQTIAAYPMGGGSYIVATENLGIQAGMLAGAALMIDYILNVCVGISAGVGAVVSAFPALQPHTLGLCLAILLVLTIVNLRGVREAGVVFMAPTYAFVACLGAVIVTGLFKTILSHGHPLPASPIPRPGPATAVLTIWLLVKAFSSGCTAMTGVEAVSNGVQAFCEPQVKNARATLATIIGTLILLLAGIAYLCRVYGIAATNPGSGYQTVLSQLTEAADGRGAFYFITMFSVFIVLALSANTSFADFPRVCRSIAEKRYLPYLFTIRGPRLVFSFGIYVLAFVAGFLLIIFDGVTDRLIPLFAIGAFTAFTLSQAGMVMHWKRNGAPAARRSMWINGLGSLVTGAITCALIVAKFTQGAWITVFAIPGLILLMRSVHRHYETMERDTTYHGEAKFGGLAPPMVVLPLLRWSKVAEKGLRFAYTLSQEVLVLHIVPEEEHGGDDELSGIWEQYIEKPAVEAGWAPPRLMVLRSPYRQVVTPILKYVLELAHKNPNRLICVLIPELVERRWYYFPLHNQRAAALKLMLYIKGNGRIFVINVPRYVRL
jgi:amino acid transporter